MMYKSRIIVVKSRYLWRDWANVRIFDYLCCRLNGNLYNTY